MSSWMSLDLNTEFYTLDDIHICISKENIQSLDSQFCRFTYLLHHHHVYYLIVFALVFFYYFSSLFMDELMQYESDVFMMKVFESTFSYG